MNDDERHGWIAGLWATSVFSMSMLFLAIGAGFQAGGEASGPQDGSAFVISLAFTGPVWISWVFRLVYLAGRRSR